MCDGEEGEPLFQTKSEVLKALEAFRARYYEVRTLKHISREVYYEKSFKKPLHWYHA